MSKKMKVLIAVLVAILTLTVSGAVAVLAQEDEEVEPDEEELLGELNEIMPRVRMFVSTESSELLSRVAKILSISEEELSDAFAQAKQEMMAERCEEAFYEFLERAVEEGLITEEEAEEIEEWWEKRPEALNWTKLRNAFCIMRSNPESLTDNGWKGFQGVRQNIQQRLKECKNSELRMEMLEKAIEEGLITEEDASEIKVWTGNTPAALNQLSPKPRIMNEVRGRHMIAIQEGWHGPRTYQNTD
ncbi:MAG: hypothetical protein ABIK32_07675 [Chloroflexota bacterium]|nr:hypothetical protein [Chloroflexota bacterium]